MRARSTNADAVPTTARDSMAWYRRPRPQVLLLALLVGAAAAWAHWPVLSSRAMMVDDAKWLTENRLVRDPSWASVWRAFTQVLQPADVPAYYHPVTLVSLILDRALTSQTDFLRAVRRTNLVLHVLNSALVVVLLYLLLGQPWAAALAGLVFAVHPLTVEPVAWMTERKTLLAAFFTFLSLILYIAYARGRSRPAYAASFATGWLALLSKPTSVPLPLLMLVLDYWPLRRLNWRAVPEKLPFFALAAVSLVITYISQSRTMGVVTPAEQTPARALLVLCHNVVFYLWKAVYPADLTAHYPFPEPFALSNPHVLAGVIGTPLLLGALALSLRWTRAGLAGWLFFFVAIFPALGVVQVVYLIAGDKHAYLPAPGLLLILAAGLKWLSDQRGPAAPRLRRVASTGVVLVLAALAARTTRAQLKHWQTTEALYRRMVRFAPQLVAVRNDLALELDRQGRLAEAMEQYAAALRLAPGSAKVHTNVALALERRGQPVGALEHLREALRLDPLYARAAYHLGRLLLAQGHDQEALKYLDESVRLEPDSDLAYCRVGSALSQRGYSIANAEQSAAYYRQALPYLEQALRLNPRYAEAHNDLANALLGLGQLQPAIEHYEAALRLRPEMVGAYVNLGDTWLRLRRPEAAVTSFRQAIRADPGFLPAYKRLGQLLLMAEDPEAIDVYEAALRIAPQDADLRANLERARALANPK